MRSTCLRAEETLDHRCQIAQRQDHQHRAADLVEVDRVARRTVRRGGLLVRMEHMRVQRPVQPVALATAFPHREQGNAVSGLRADPQVRRRQETDILLAHQNGALVGKLRQRIHRRQAVIQTLPQKPHADHGLRVDMGQYLFEIGAVLVCIQQYWTGQLCPRRVGYRIHIADDRPLSYTQAEVIRRGFAMELRINAEDPKNDFLPSFGRITRYFAPGGPGVRTDAAIYSGYQIPPHYDSMCAKLTVWALAWPDLLNRASRALQDTGVYGVKTTIPYYLELLKVPEFRAGHFDTGFVEDHPELVGYTTSRPTRELTAALAAAVSAHMGL